MHPLVRSPLHLDLSRPNLSVMIDPGSPHSSIGTPTPFEVPERPPTPEPIITEIAIATIGTRPLTPIPKAQLLNVRRIKGQNND